MAVMHFLDNRTNSQQTLARVFTVGTHSVGCAKSTVTNKPTSRTMLVVLVWCWLPLTNILKYIDTGIEGNMLAVGSFLAIIKAWGLI